MEGAYWMDIRSDRQKGTSYTDIARKYYIDPRTAKRYAESPQRPEYTLTGPKPTKLDAYKQQVDQWLEEAPYWAVRLKENLEALKMRNTLDILDNYLERAIKDELNIVDILDHIFAEEARNRRHRAYEKQIQMSGFPIKKTLEDFDFSFQPSIDKRQIAELATMRFVENAENVVFLGPPGVGKTHLANALGMVAAKNRYSTYYINCHTLMEQLKKAITRIDYQIS